MKTTSIGKEKIILGPVTHLLRAQYPLIFLLTTFVLHTNVSSISQKDEKD